MAGFEAEGSYFASQVSLVVKRLLANAGLISASLMPPPWRREWQPTLVFLPGEPHEWRSLAGYIPKGHKESVGHD